MPLPNQHTKTNSEVLKEAIQKETLELVSTERLILQCLDAS